MSPKFRPTTLERLIGEFVDKCVVLVGLRTAAEQAGKTVVTRSRSPVFMSSSDPQPMILAAGFQCPSVTSLDVFPGTCHLKDTITTPLNWSPGNVCYTRASEENPKLPPQWPQIVLGCLLLSPGLHPPCRPSHLWFVGVRWCLIF